MTATTRPAPRRDPEAAQVVDALLAALAQVRVAVAALRAHRAAPPARSH